MKILTVKEVADLIKSRPSTIYSWAEQGIIPSIKLNGLLRFDEGEILQWIEKCKVSGETNYNVNTGRRPREGGQI
jgi:excisionase family DNA binding protein